MALIGSRADFNMEMFNPNRRVDLSSFNGGANEGGSRMYGVPAIGWTAPAFNRTDVYFGGGMYGTSGLGVDYDVFNAGAFGQADIFTAIQFWKMAPTVAARVTDRLTLGIALNGDYQSVEIKEAFRGIVLPGAPPLVSLDLSRSPGTFGIGTTLGAMYKAHDRVDIGFSYSSQQYFQDTEYRLPAGAVTNFPQSNGTATNAAAGRYDLDLNYPQQWALGVAARPMDRWLVSFDVKWINWAATHDAVKLKGSFMLNGTQPIDTIALPFGWDNQWVFAVGTQYQVTDAFAVRAGFNHAKAPIDEADVFNNLAFPAVVEDHLTLGATYRLGDHWEMSGAYKKALKNELTGKSDIPTPFQTLAGTDSGAKISMDQHSVGVQISYRF
jgi:long-chain fatty acid transport protein